LEKPPKENVLETEFRSINNKIPDISKNLKDTIIEMDSKKTWISDYRNKLGWDKLEIINQFNENKKDNIETDVIIAKELIELKEYWYKELKNYGEAFNLIRNKLEEKGILTMKNGVVGMNTHRKLNINEFRAFMLYDDIAPLIFINNNDSMGGKIFSLIHEYIHILLEKEDVIVSEEKNRVLENETYINKITAEFLMPKKHIEELWDKQKNDIVQIIELSKLMKVSSLALAIRLNNLAFIDNSIVKIIRKKALKEFDKKDNNGGGDFYKTYNTRISKNFKEAVINEVESGEITYTYAFELLGGIKGRTYDKIKEDMISYD
jgi:Zn-dependent peptidase ImmA (M78 family)